MYVQFLTSLFFYCILLYFKYDVSLNKIDDLTAQLIKVRISLHIVYLYNQYIH